MEKTVVVGSVRLDLVSSRISVASPTGLQEKDFTGSIKILFLKRW